jgi:hypothetical protein
VVGLKTWLVLRQRWFFLAVVGLGVGLALPSLGVGFVADDYTFLARLEQPGPAQTFRLYEFATGAPGQYERLMSSHWAAFPWWVSSNFKVCFLRPLASAAFALDHELFGHAPLGYHVHCLLWYALLLVAVGLLLRRVCPPPVWQVAFLLFALSSSHAESLAWISSRHMLVSTAPPLLGLLALIHFRERGWRLGLGLGLLGMTVGLAGGEAALSVACYWLAYEALGGPPGMATRQRQRNVALTLGYMAAYLLLYKLLGYGVSGSAAYLDPISAPGAFGLALPGRVAMLLGEGLGGLSANLGFTTLPKTSMAVGVAFALAVGLGLRSAWATLPAELQRALRWLSAGALLALLVNAGAFLGSRLLLIPGIALYVIIASLLVHGWTRVAAGSATLARRALWSVLLLVHVVVAPLGLLANTYWLAMLGGSTRAIDGSLDAHFQRHRSRAPRAPWVYVLAASDPFSGFYVASVRAVRARGTTAQWSILSMARATYRIERTAANAFVIDVEPGLLRSAFEGLMRARGEALAVGDERRVEGGVVTVRAVEAGRPTSLGFRLSQGSFDDDDVCVLVWRDGKLLPVELQLHEELRVPWSPGPTGLL